MAKKYVVYYWYDRLGKWIRFYSHTDKSKCESIAEFQRKLGDKVKIEEED